MIEDTSMYSGVIYGIHNGDFNYRYIGKTQQTLKLRFQGHQKDMRKGTKRPLYDWMRKHGDTVQVCVIATFDEDTVHLINEVERFHIAQNQGNGSLNLAVGGEGAVGVKRSMESRMKQSASLRANPSSYVKTDDHRKALSVALTGRTVGPSHAIHLDKISGLGTHTRWHVNRNVVKEGCDHCGE